ncbi:MAG TPA: twin-arginine translocase TatA/TatE family subunit [Sphingomicrobium sp.]|jgi:sec-independent protein translocase protein TatA
MGLGGISHWIIILVIVLLLFGAGRISGVMGELGKGLKSFKEGMGDEEEEKRRRYEDERRNDPPRLARDQDPIDVSARREEGVAPRRDDERR